MKLAIDIDDLTSRSPDDLTAVGGALAMRRGDNFPIEIIVSRDGVAIEMPSGTTAAAYLTERDDYDALLSSSTDFTASGTGPDYRLTGTLNLDQAAIDSVFTLGSTKTANASLEIEVDDGTSKRSSLPITVTLHNSYTAA